MRFDLLFDHAFESFDRLFDDDEDVGKKVSGKKASPWTVVSKDGKLEMSIPVPGAGPEDIEASLVGRKLSIKLPDSPRGASRRFEVDLKHYDVDGLEVRVDKGILTVTAEPLSAGDGDEPKPVKIWGARA